MGREVHHGTNRGQGGKCTSPVTETDALLSMNTCVEPLYQPLQVGQSVGESRVGAFGTYGPWGFRMALTR